MRDHTANRDSAAARLNLDWTKPVARSLSLLTDAPGHIWDRAGPAPGQNGANPTPHTKQINLL